MHDAHDFLQTLAVVLCVAAVTTVVFQRLRQPVVFGYLLAGMIVGPHIPIPLVADEAIVETLSELGVILVLFSLGLEFSLRKLLRSPAADRTLAELNLRGVTGATVLAILRDGEQVLVPSGHDRVRGGDVLAVAGFEESLAAARELLTGVGQLGSAIQPIDL